jgi:thioester reductase-like protein
VRSPAAGLDPDVWQSLAADVDAIVHAGASINWIAGYDALRDVNVLATRELLRLACEAGAAFHYVSSASVCYSTTGPRAVDEHHDALDTIDGLHFGYAQSKAVAEALVREAGRRGLRARIYRPALISGDSRTGRFNQDDMLSRLIAGCVRMGTAPDLDWRLDALPVDTVANTIVALAGRRGLDTSHLVHPRPRHWRECVLWMRLYGYDVTLVPYRDWTHHLRDAITEAGHPLRPLRSFFLDEAADGLTIPELHEQDRAPALDARRTCAAIEESGIDIPALDASLMDRYFAAFVAGAMLPAPTRRRPRRKGGIDTAANGAVPFAAGHSIISELTAWQSGGACGLFHVPGPDGRPRVLKIPALAADVHAVGEALAGICGERLGAAYSEFGSGLGTTEGAAREIALYRDGDPLLRAHTPAVVSTHADPGAQRWTVVLEDLRGLPLLDSVDRPHAWTRAHVETAVDGIAAIHGAWYGRVAELRRQPWMATQRTTTTMREMTPLWRALADHAAPFFSRAAGPALSATHRALIDSIAEWRPRLDLAPQTLIHNDFNPRNVCLRRIDPGADRRPDPGSDPAAAGFRLCAFDWELAAIGTPMRDVAEFLCFVAPVDVDRAWVEELIARHTTRFALTAGVRMNAGARHATFGAALAEILVDRLSIYAMVHRVRPQAFLPRVLRTWTALHSLFPVR